jgi:hypothetical protein
LPRFEHLDVRGDGVRGVFRIRNGTTLVPQQHVEAFDERMNLGRLMQACDEQALADVGQQVFDDGSQELRDLGVGQELGRRLGLRGALLRKGIRLGADLGVEESGDGLDLLGAQREAVIGGGARVREGALDDV